MTDHTRIEKIGGDSIHFCGQTSRAGNRYDSLMIPLETIESQTNILSYVVFVIFRMLNLSVFHFRDVFMASFIYVLIIMVLFIILLVNKSRSSFSTHSRAFCIT